MNSWVSADGQGSLRVDMDALQLAFSKADGTASARGGPARAIHEQGGRETIIVAERVTVTEDRDYVYMATQGRVRTLTREVTRPEAAAQRLRQSGGAARVRAG